MKRLESVALISVFIAILYFGIFSFLPFGFWVDVDRIEWTDVCVGGDTNEKVIAYRTSLFDIRGSGYGSAILFEGEQRIETTIKRASLEEQITFTYESAFNRAVYDVRWNEPYENIGEYGAQDTVTLYPLPLIKVSKVFRAEDNRFNVVECN